ncbi:MAG: Shikimate dehydrogenase [Thermoanaerobacterales bacterium 50_218]|nr:MAG: Shikimate dehydrogenase [Thermoanaerobacterales bacterium 50_218]HAA89345.1 shikimate dehydrogenase [Peptococcaceae bacterium]
MVITGKTRVYGLFGDPVGHSLSPLMQNTAFAFYDFPCCYVPFQVKREDLSVAVASIRALGMGGVNITIPHKEKVLAHLDQVDKEAELIGAVNTVVNRDGLLVGYNTDGAGFIRSLQEEAGFDPEGKKVVLLGAGGAARAVAFALALRGIGFLWIFNRTPARAQLLAQDVAEKTGCQTIGAGLEAELVRNALEQAQLLVHASPVGMYPHHDEEPLIDPLLLPPEVLVCDLVYNPPRTRLLSGAAERGCRVLSGLGMLVYQGALAFELWTGKKAPVSLMRSVLEEQLSRQASR